MSDLKISVIVPVYNTQDYLRECFDSMISQSLKEIEIIAVDDCSDDNSLEILKEYALKDERVKVIALNERKTTGMVRNAGLDIAQGEFVAFMDADDLYARSDVLEKLYEAAKENKVDAAAGNMALFDKNDLKNLRMYGEKDWNFYEVKIKDFADYVYTCGYTRFIYKREMIENFNIRFPDCVRREDPVFFQEIMLKIGKFATIPEVVYAYRVNHKEVVWSDAMLSDAITAYQKQIEMFRRDNMDKHLQQLCVEFVNDINYALLKLIMKSRNKKQFSQEADSILKLKGLDCKTMYNDLRFKYFLRFVGVDWSRFENYIRVKLWGIKFKIKKRLTNK